MKKYAKILSILLCLSMLVGMIAMVASAEEGATYKKVTSADELTTGQYILVNESGYALGVFDNGWVTGVETSIDGDTTDGAGLPVWTLTVDGSTAKLTDANGVSIKPKAGNNKSNGIESGDYSWTLALADGNVTISGSGDDTNVLAFNADTKYLKFRSYKNSTVTGANASTYPSAFTLYKFVEPVVEEPTEPEVTEPATEPDASEKVLGGLPVPVVGYYDGEGNFTENNYPNETNGNPALLVDGAIEPVYATGHINVNEWVQNGGDKTAAFIFDMGNAPITLNGLFMQIYTTRYYLVDFRVEVKTSADGEWENVGTYTDAYENPAYGFDASEENDETYYYMFDKTVTAYQLRILVDEFVGKNEEKWIIQLYEIAPMIVEKAEEPEQPSEPEVPSEPETPDNVVYEIVSPSKLDTVFGYYRDAADESSFWDGKDGYCVTDGWYGRAGYSECTTADGQIVLIMSINETINFGAIEFVSNGEGNPAEFVVEALVDGAWVKVLEVDGNPLASDPTILYTFNAVQTSKVRVLVNKVDDDGKCKLKEVSLFQPKEGTPKVNVDLSDIITGDGNNGDNASLVDGDKGTVFVGSNIEINLTVDGAPTVINGFNLYHYRAGAAFATEVNLLVKKTADGDYEAIGTWATNWTDGNPKQDSVFITLDEAVEAYAVKFTFNKWAYINELEVFQFAGAEAPVDPEQPTDPTDPSEPEVTDPSEPEVTEPALELDAAYLQYAALPEPIFGYYDADGKLVSYTYGDWTGANIVDGNLFSLGCTDYFKNTSELLQNGGTKHPVVYFDMGNNPMTINGLQYITNWNENCFATDLYIQVKTSDDGEWETVFEANGLDFNENECKDFRFKTVTVYEMRIVITAFQYPAGNERCAIQEISPWVVVDGPKPIQIPVTAVTGGYYDDGEEMSNLVGGFMASNVADGKWQNYDTVGTENDEWIFATDLLSGRGGIYTPAYILYFDEPQVISRVEVYAQRGILGAYFPSEIVIQAEDENGDWITVAEGTSADWEGAAVFEFTPVQTQQIRVLATVINRVNGEAAHYRVNEIVVYSYEGAVPGETPEKPTEPSEPTEPSVPEETDPTVPSEPEVTEPSAPAAGNTASKADELNDGDKVVIFYNEGNTVISNTVNGKKLDAAEATFDGDKLVVADGMLVLTVSIDADGNITFITEDGKYLTAGATGNSLSLADEASEYSLWVLETTEGGYLVKNVNAAYNGNPQYLEFYSGFTTYGISATSNLAIYTFNFYVLDEAEVEEPTEPSEPSEPSEPEDPTEPSEPTEPDQPGKTGDVALSVLVGMLAISAIGGAVVISKKKEF